MSKNRLAVVDYNKCKPSKCNKECIKSCPPQKSGKIVIDIEDVIINSFRNQVAKIAENLCIGCNICIKKCPFDAIKIINLPFENENDVIHRYGSNGFKLYGLPIMKTNCVIGLIGSNGIGKTTLIEILSNIIRPNFATNNVFDIKSIITKYRGSVLNFKNSKIIF